MTILEHPDATLAADGTTHTDARETWWNEVGEPAEITTSAYHDNDTTPVLVIVTRHYLVTPEDVAEQIDAIRDALSAEGYTPELADDFPRGGVS
jgi:hypothetical protein